MRIKIANLILGIVTALIIIVGDVFPLMGGIVLTFAEVLGYFIAGLDPLSGPARTFGGFPTLILTILLAVFAILIFIFSIVAFFLAKKLHFKTTAAFYITNCVLSVLAVAIEVYCALWLNSEIYESVYHVIYYAWPVIGGLLAIAMIVLTVLGLKTIKEDINFQDMLEDMRQKNSGNFN